MATCLSLVLHVLALTGMVLGLKVVAPPPEDRAMELRLILAPEPRPPPEPVHRAPERSNAAPPLRPPLTPEPSSEASVAAPRETSAPAAEETGPKGLLPSLSGRLGCDGALASRLTAEQHQVCADNLARLAKEAVPLGPDIAEQKKAEYDRWVRCGQTYRHAAIPGSDEVEPDAMAGGVPPPDTGIDPHWNLNAGMGHIPGECVVRGR